MPYLLKDGIPALALMFALPLLFSHVEEKKMKLHKKNAAMKQEIQKHIAIGSGIEDAKRIMERNGFECSFVEEGGFEEVEDGRHSRSHDNVDYLYCNKEKGGFICSRRWQIAIVHKNRIVSDILVSIGETCP